MISSRNFFGEPGTPAAGLSTGGCHRKSEKAEQTYKNINVYSEAQHFGNFLYISIDWDPTNTEKT